MSHSVRSQSTGGNSVTLNKIKESTEGRELILLVNGDLACFKGLILLNIIMNIPPVRDDAENRAPRQGSRQGLVGDGGEGLTFRMGLTSGFKGI